MCLGVVCAYSVGNIFLLGYLETRWGCGGKEWCSGSTQAVWTYGIVFYFSANAWSRKMERGGEGDAHKFEANSVPCLKRCHN